jgi:hypothetical protein
MSAIQNDGGAAFPIQILASPGSEIQEGMSLRDWFAGQALGFYVNHLEMTQQEISAACYAQADAMLAERAKTT